MKINRATNVSNPMSVMACLLTVSFAVCSTIRAAAPAAAQIQLSAEGEKLLAKYTAQLTSAKSELEKVLPKIDEQEKLALQKLRDAAKAAATAGTTAQQGLGKVNEAKALVEHAKGKWLGGAEKGIAQAEAALKRATTDAERAAANKELAKWQADKEAGLKALKERQAVLDKVKADEPQLVQANQSAQAAATQAKASEMTAAKALLTKLSPVLASDKLDATILKGAVLSGATPRGLAEFAQQGKTHEAMVDKLLAETGFMKQMLEAGGAKFGKYGKALEIYTAIRKASPKSGEGTLQRLALAMSLEHASPVAQGNAKDQTYAPTTVDPVIRYMHYEKAFLDGELDPAFKDFTTWEMRMAVDCNAPDSVLAWGREMLRTYRPDHVYTPDYGWRYSASVRTDVAYGSQNVQFDLPSLHEYQNILRNGGVCGRRAFFGRFILQASGIPTWGVTQHKHAALSHWTPKGWVVNLGAGFEHSWWDKDEAPRSGSDFLMETQAREHGQEYLKVLRAQWVSAALGEQAYNDRKGIPGGFWSSLSRYQSAALASSAVSLGPLGQELAEASESKEKQFAGQPKASPSEQKVEITKNGAITIPAAAISKSPGRFAAMKSFVGGMQIHCTGGFKADYSLDVPRAGKYAMVAKVATVQEGQKFNIGVNDAKSPMEIAVPYTTGVWQDTKPVEVTLGSGKNVLNVALVDGSRGVTVKEFTLTPIK